MATKLCPYCAEEIQYEAIKCKHCGTWLDGSHAASPMGFGEFQSTGGYPGRPLVRSSTDCMWAGVCGGLAQYLGVNSTLLRVSIALASIFTAIIPGLIAYMVCVALIPREDSFAPRR